MLGTRSRRRGDEVDAADVDQGRAGTTAALYEECGRHAFAVAEGLTHDRRAAEEIVVDVFVFVDGLPRCVNAVTERQRVFAHVVARCWDASTFGAAQHETVWDLLPWRHRVAVALTSRGRCSLDDAATILGIDRTEIAQDIRAALHAIK